MRMNCVKQRSARQAAIRLVLILIMLSPGLLSAETSSSDSTEIVTKTLLWPDGTRYVGGVRDGKRWGKGTIFWQDGTRFVGTFANDLRNGPGTMILPDGTVYNGYFKDDALVDAPAPIPDQQVASRESSVISSDQPVDTAPTLAETDTEVSESMIVDSEFQAESDQSAEVETEITQTTEEQTYIAPPEVIEPEIIDPQLFETDQDEPQIADSSLNTEEFEAAEVDSVVTGTGTDFAFEDTEPEDIPVEVPQVEVPREADIAVVSDEEQQPFESGETTLPVDTFEDSDQEQVANPDISTGSVIELTESVRMEVESMIDLWSLAWSEQNVEEYLTHYSDEFRVPGRQSRRQWEALRRSRLTRPGSIEIKVVFENFELTEENVVQIQFNQSYRSNLFRDQTRKQLTVKMEGENWRIIEERSL